MQIAACCKNGQQPVNSHKLQGKNLQGVDLSLREISTVYWFHGNSSIAVKLCVTWTSI